MGVGGSAPVVSAHRPQDDRALVCSACGAAKEGYAAADAAAALVTHTPHSAGPHVRQYVPHALRCSFSLTPNTQTQSQTPNLKPQTPNPKPQTRTKSLSSLGQTCSFGFGAAAIQTVIELEEALSGRVGVRNAPAVNERHVAHAPSHKLPADVNVSRINARVNVSRINARANVSRINAGAWSFELGMWDCAPADVAAEGSRAKQQHFSGRHSFGPG